MSEAAAATANQPDPMEKMRELSDAYMDVWSKYLVETVNTESYAEASGAALKNYLDAAAPFKEPAEQAMLKTLQHLNMPTSVDFASLAGRFTNIEMQMDNMDAKLDRILSKLGAAKPAQPAAKATASPAAKRAPAKKLAARPAAKSASRPAARATAAKARSAKKSSTRKKGTR